MGITSVRTRFQLQRRARTDLHGLASLLLLDPTRADVGCEGLVKIHVRCNSVPEGLLLHLCLPT